MSQLERLAEPFLLDERLDDEFFESLNALTATDFEINLARAAIDNLELSSPLCLNNFAYALRELLRHILHRLAPDEEVLSCDWFPKERRERGKIHRFERVKYIIQGGMSDWAAENVLGADVATTATKLSRVNETLSAYTHVNEETFAVGPEKIAATVKASLGLFAELVGVIAEGKRQLTEFLEPIYEEHTLEQFLFETQQNLDELSTHHWIDGYEIYSVKIAEISSRAIELDIQGDVDVGMQYGSDSDVRQDIGARMNLNWPFTAKILVELIRPLGSKSQLICFEVDTSGWYE